MSLQATAEANNLAAVATAKDQYYKSMEKVGSLSCEIFRQLSAKGEILKSVVTCCCFLSQVCGGDLPYVSPDSLEERHHFNLREALYTFSSTKKMGGQEFCERYQAQLEKELEEMWESFCKHNEVKKLLHTHDISTVPVFK